MAAYEGLIDQPDKIVGGGAWVKEHKDGGETCNFLTCDDGYVYGHVETIKGKIDRPISIDLLGADVDARFVDHIDVVWTATDPKRKGRWVVGWYRDARVFRERQHFRKAPSAQHRREKDKGSYRIRTKSSNAILIPVKQRDIQLGRGKGWIGHANWWFPERQRDAAVRRFVKRMRTRIEEGPGSTSRNETRSGGRNWGGLSDPIRNAQVEEAAILKVSEHFAEHRITRVEKDNVGWDLEALPKGGGKVLCLEVKGLFGNELKVGLTPREYRAFRGHLDGAKPQYRLCVVTEALSTRSKLIVLRFDQQKQHWVDDVLDQRVRPSINVLQSAIVSIG